MDYKEKVIELLKSNDVTDEQKEKLKSIFPELKESSTDENYNKILDGLKYLMPGYDGTGISYNEPNWVLTMLEEGGTISFYGETFDDVIVQAFNNIKQH